MDEFNPNVERQALHNVLKNIIEEAKMILPGTETLFGFQLIVVFSDYFQVQFSKADRFLHFTAMLLTLISFALIISLVAYHRRVQVDLVTRKFVVLGTRILKSGMVPLLLAISIDFYLVAHHTFQNLLLAVISAVFVFTLLISLWYILPLFGIKEVSE